MLLKRRLLIVSRGNRPMKNLFISLLLLVASPPVAYSYNIDSLLQVVDRNPDASLINRLYEIGNEVEMQDTDAAKRIYRKAGELSERIDYPVGRIKFASNYTFLLNQEGKFDSSLQINQRALELAREINDEEQFNKMLVNTGNVYHYKRLYNIALDYYTEALPWFEKEGNPDNLSIIYDLMQVFYQRTDQFEKGIDFGRKAVELTKDKPDDINRGYILNNLASLFARTVPRRWDEQMECLKEALRIAEVNKHIELKASVLTNMANYYLQTFDIQSSEAYTRQALSLREKTGNIEGYIINLRGLAYQGLHKGDYREAEESVMKAIHLAREHEFITQEQKCYLILAELALIRDSDYLKSKKMEAAADSLASMILNDKIMRANEELRIKYDTEQKELQIESLNQRHKFNVLITLIGGTALAAGLLALLFLWLWTRQKRRKSELQLKQLEQEKQLVAARSILEGEMQERSRLARDLHDGLGGMLSAAKINMSEYRSGAMLETQDVEAVNRVMNLLDESLSELRRVAHHLMPESLSRYGLKIALSDFCRTVDIIEFAWFGNEDRLEKQLEVVIYRIVHELVNNALRYSEATHILVHIVQDIERISLTVEDNGLGFDITAATKGTGLQHIRERVAALDGNIEISSVKNEGTEIHAEFKIKSKGDRTDKGSKSEKEGES